MCLLIRDIKPSNILVDYEGTPVLTDFEIARDDTLHGTVTVAPVARGLYPYRICDHIP